MTISDVCPKRLTRSKRAISGLPHLVAPSGKCVFCGKTGAQLDYRKPTE